MQKAIFKLLESNSFSLKLVKWSTVQRSKFVWLNFYVVPIAELNYSILIYAVKYFSNSSCISFLSNEIPIIKSSLSIVISFLSRLNFSRSLMVYSRLFINVSALE